MNIFTIGYTKKSAQNFFELIQTNKIDTLMDIRLYNSTQLAGFSKSQDLKYFLKQLCNCDYVWTPQFAPSKELFDNYKSESIDWKEYEVVYQKLLNSKNNLDFFKTYENQRICLLCAEATAECCHRRLLAEKIANAYKNVIIEHL